MSASDWQTWAALGVVAMTAVLLAVRSASRKGGGCGSCGGHSNAGKKPPSGRRASR